MLLMKKLIMIFTPVILFLLINLSYLETINLRYVYPNRYKHNLFPGENEVFDYVVTGHSQARDSFDFELISKSGINLGLSSQDIYWSIKMLNHYSDYYNDNTRIIIELSHQNFCLEPQFKRTFYIPLGFPRSQIKLSLTEYYLAKFFPLVGMNGFNILRGNQTHFANIDSEFETEDELIANSKKYLASVIDTQINCSYEIQNLNREILSELIEEQIQLGREVILYSAPLHEVVSNNIDFSKSLQKQILKENIEYLTNKYSVAYYDFSYLAEVSSNYFYFRNANHLNSEGAKRFMEIFFYNVYNSNDIE